MNSLKQHLSIFSVLRSPFSVLRSPFSVLRVPALSPGVMAVEAAPDFHYEDARADCPSAVRAPKRPVAPGRRAIFLKVILLSAALAVAGIGGAHAAPQECKVVGQKPIGNWKFVTAIPNQEDAETGSISPIFVKPALVYSYYCFNEQPVNITYRCCDAFDITQTSVRYGKRKRKHTVMAKYLSMPAMVPGGSNPSAFNQALNMLFDITSTDMPEVGGFYFFESRRGLKCSGPPDEIDPVVLLEPPPTAECPDENYTGRAIDVYLPHLGTGVIAPAIKPKKPEKKKPKTDLTTAGLGLSAAAGAAAVAGALGGGDSGGEAGEAHGGEAGGAHGDEDRGYSARQMRDARDAAAHAERLRQMQRLHEQRQRLWERWRQLNDLADQRFQEALSQISEGNRQEFERLVLERRQVLEQANQVMADITGNVSGLMDRKL